MYKLKKFMESSVDNTTKTKNQTQMSNKQEKFYCSNHLNVEAAVLCDTCSTMSGCSGYLCKECDELVHKAFAEHQREAPRPIEKKMCNEHLDHSVSELFCYETEALHCALCAKIKGIKGDSIPVAIGTVSNIVKKGISEIEENLKKMHGDKDAALFELNDEGNPKNLETQMNEARKKNTRNL